MWEFVVAISNNTLMQEHDLCTYISYKLSDFPCSLLTHIHAGRTHKMLSRHYSRGKLAALQELHS